MGVGKLGQTITVVNKSGEIVSSSKHLVTVFKEAKSAYQERKAEIRAVRDAELEKKRAQISDSAPYLREDGVIPSSHPRRSSTEPCRRESKPSMERGYSDSIIANDEPQPYRSSRLRHQHDLEDESAGSELRRRHTDGDYDHVIRRKPVPHEPVSDRDDGLAYGELPPPLPVRGTDDERELRYQMTKANRFLDEFHCLQHSASATIATLQKNPDALAAVALTLAEISNLLVKMQPGALLALKGSFPAVIALLASPQFLIAAGVGVGITVVAIGGYKIIKKIKDKKRRERESPEEMDELEEIGSDLSRIETWRRGIADTEASSLGTSVEGEFITPKASRQLLEAGVLREDDLGLKKSSRRGSRSSGTAKSEKSDKAKSKVSAKSSKASKGERRIKKEPSGLRMLFRKD